MVWTDVAPWLVGQATKISFFNKLLENTKWHRDSTGDFTKVPIGDGYGVTPGSPGYHWNNSPTTGLYQSGPDQLGISVSGVQKINIASTLIDIQTTLQAMNLQLTNPLPIAYGGTGATSATNILSTLGISTGTATPTAPISQSLSSKDISEGCSYVQIGKNVFVVGRFKATGAVTGFTAIITFNVPVPGSIVAASGSLGDRDFPDSPGRVVLSSMGDLEMSWVLRNTALTSYTYNYHYTLL